MSTIPKDIQEEAERRFPNREYNNQGGYTDQEYNILFKQISNEIKQRQQDFIDGYQLATDGREELEKELAQLLHDVQQILSAYAMDETWTDWDESVRKRVIELQYKLQDNGNSK